MINVEHSFITILQKNFSLKKTKLDTNLVIVFYFDIDNFIVAIKIEIMHRQGI